jgi:hypothetical protein
VIVLSDASLARAQTLPSNGDARLSAQDVLHIADMITTTVVLTNGRDAGAIEGNRCCGRSTTGRRCSPP